MRMKKLKPKLPLANRPPVYAFILSPAARLDRLADMELQHGHHMAAEILSQKAAEMRGAA